MNYLFSLLWIFLMANCSPKTQSKNSNTMQSNISKIEYRSGGCFGTCPVYTMTIDAQRNAIFDAQQFNFSNELPQKAEGKFESIIKLEDYQELISKIESLNPTSMKDFYGDRNISDLPTAHLIITFKDGKTKIIEDYGKNGTESLKRVYDFFDALRTNQNWKKIAE